MKRLHKMTMKDYSGEKFGRLTVLRFSRKHKGKYFWICKCSCGNEKEVCIMDLKTGNTKSCGCIRRENPTRIKIRNLSKTRLHKIYTNMKNRCLNKNEIRYKDYGGRGIKICEEWLIRYEGFLNFYDWAINNGYKETLTLDRIDNNGNYCPENCRWIEISEQNRNKRTNILITINNKTRCVSDWCHLYEIKIPAIYNYSKRNNVSLKDSLLRKIKI